MGERLEIELLAHAWGEVSGGGAATSLPVPVDVTGAPGQLESHFAVAEIALACVGVGLTAAARLQQQRGGTVASIGLDRGHVAAAVRSERYFRRGSQSAGVGFAPLSRFWPAADGWVRTHANYPWHRRALLAALQTADEIGAVGNAIAALPGQDVEERVFAAGGIAAAVRTLDAWRAHPQGKALADEPLIGHRVIGDAAPRIRPQGTLPASGVKVLDLTRVIAGPVCTRYLAALGADVLRLDPPSHPDMARNEASDTLLGKRSALLDLHSPAGLATAHELLDRADVVVSGYRPGALDKFGLDEEALAARHPGIVVVYLDAWGHSGPWRGRRGFDSVVQAPTGIALGESIDGVEPGTLACQLLDHGTGYLAAASALDGLRRQSEDGGTHIRRLSLARTSSWLTSTSATRPDTAASPAVDDSQRWVVELDATDGLRAVAPPGSIDGRALQWPTPVTGYGSDSPSWPDS